MTVHLKQLPVCAYKYIHTSCAVAVTYSVHELLTMKHFPFACSPGEASACSNKTQMSVGAPTSRLSVPTRPAASRRRGSGGGDAAAGRSMRRRPPAVHTRIFPPVNTAAQSLSSVQSTPHDDQYRNTMPMHALRPSASEFVLRWSSLQPHNAIHLSSLWRFLMVP